MRESPLSASFPVNNFTLNFKADLPLKSKFMLPTLAEKRTESITEH